MANTDSSLSNRSKTRFASTGSKAAKLSRSRDLELRSLSAIRTRSRGHSWLLSSHPCELYSRCALPSVLQTLALVAKPKKGFVLACCRPCGVQMGKGTSKNGVFTKRDKRSGQRLAPKTKLRKGKSTASTDSLAARNVVVIIGGVVAAVLLWLEYKGY